MKITIGKTESGKAFALPADAVTQKIALLARTGGGKTYAAKVLAEEFMHAKFPIVCIDPIGVWWGLRAEGESRGFEILIAGGDHQDIPLEPASGKIIADFFVRERVPMILDLSRFGENEMRRFVADFASELYRINRDVMHLFVDEADEFAPQGGGKAMGPDIGRCLSAMQNVVRRGRARGIGCTLITQRSAVLSKSVLTQTEALFCFQTTGPQDLKAIDEWIQYHGTKDERNKIMGGLTKLQRGECWFYSPAWIKTLERIRIRTLKTFDSSRTPAPGESVRPPKSIADVNLPELTDRMKSCVEQAKANDPKELRREIAQLRSQLAAKPEAKADQEAVQRAVNAAVERERQSIAAEQRKREQQFIAAITKQQNDMAKARDALELNGFELPEPLDLSGRPMPFVPCGGVLRKEVTDKPKPAETLNYDTSFKRSGGEYRIMAVLKQHRRPMTDKRLGMLANLSPTSGTFDTYLSRLRKRGWIEGDRLSLRITADGDAGIGHVEPLPTGQEVIEWWRLKCGSGGMLRIFDALLEAHPNGLPRDEIAKRAGMAMSGSFDTYISRLRTLGLIEGKGELKIAKELFE